MPYLLQIDFDYPGPFGDEMIAAFSDTARSINDEKGFILKVWTENEETKEAGGVYLFDTQEDAENYLTMHTTRLNGFGITSVNSKIFKTNNALSTMNHAPL